MPGMAYLCHFENTRTYDLAQVDLDYTLEEGFTIQTFSESLDFAGRVALVQSAFDNPSYTENNLKRLMAATRTMIQMSQTRTRRHDSLAAYLFM